MDKLLQTIINKSNAFNQEVSEKCQEAEKTIKDITLAFKQPVDANCCFVVSFVGRFKTGKSSLINALLGEDILPTKATTATSVVTRIFYGKVPKCWVRNETEDREISIKEGQDIILNYQVTDADKPVEVIFELPVPWLNNHIELRDTPGMDDSSQNGRLETIALNALSDTDLCVCVYDAGAMFSEKERTRTQHIHHMMSGNIVYAVNCTNRLNSLESVNQVEKLSKNFFGSMRYSVSGMGKYYMMCSAPQMTELDGFDKWFQNFVGKNNLQTLNMVRNNTGIGQVEVYKKEFAAEAKYYVEQLEQQLSVLKEKSEEVINQKRKNNIREAQNEVELFNKKAEGLCEKFVDVSFGLRDRIQSCKDKGDEYADNTKTETINYFIERYKYITSNCDKRFFDSNAQFIIQAFTGVTFPETHITSVQATRGEKNGWTIAGTVIGAIIGQGVGAAIGAAVGRFIGSANNGVDDSVDNTMDFIRSTVVPLMRTAINEELSKKRKKIKDKGNQQCDSGLDSVIFQTTKLLESLNKYYAEN